MVDALYRRMHLEAINLCKFDLNEKILGALSRDEVYVQIKEAV